MRGDVNITRTVSERTLTDSKTGSPVTVYTYEGELSQGMRKVLVKEFEAASSDVVLKVSFIEPGCATPTLI